MKSTGLKMWWPLQLMAGGWWKMAGKKFYLLPIFIEKSIEIKIEIIIIFFQYY